MDKFLIKNTTKEQRKKIIIDSLGYSNIGCDDCVNGYDMYQPYIDGEMELSEISKSYTANYVSATCKDENYHGSCMK